MEQQNVQVEEGIQLLDIVKLFISKIKYLILALIIGGILGGSFAVWRTYDVNYFGTQVEFYVNPEKNTEGTSDNESQYGVYGAYGRHVMDNMIKLLGSESFTEQLILEGRIIPEINKKDGTPWVDSSNPKEVALKLEEKIEKANSTDISSFQQDFDAIVEVRNEALVALTNAESDLQDEWTKLKKENLVSSKVFNETEYLGDDTAGISAVKGKYGQLDTAYNIKQLNETQYKTHQAAYETKKKALNDANSVFEDVLNAWRQTAKYKMELAKYQAAVSFSYLKSDEDYTDANNLARSFIYVNISVLNDEKFASDLLEIVKVVVPAYVESNMTVPSGYDGTNCQRITRTDDIHSTNPGYTTKQAIKYGLLAGAAMLLITAIVIVVMDRSDKRLRDPEDITKKFNIPLLGIVPSIDELKAELAAKNEEVKK